MIFEENETELAKTKRLPTDELSVQFMIKKHIYMVTPKL